jgi:hypothetical protein
MNTIPQGSEKHSLAIFTFNQRKDPLTRMASDATQQEKRQSSRRMAMNFWN